MNYPPKIDDWKTFDENNQATVHNFLFTEEKEICLAYISKSNSNCVKEIIP